MQVMQQHVSAKRMAQRIEKLATYSTTTKGVTRLSFTQESERANELVSHWMREAGMTVRRDAVNNLIGRYEGTNPDAPALLIGSHLDSVVEAGKYDGILGVIAGIEVVQTLFEQNFRPSHPIEVIGFCDEEGTRFHTTLLGSRALSGEFREQDLLAKDENGITLSAAMKEIGLEPSHYPLAARDPQTIRGYIELHIEQGPVLEQEIQACGVVSGIAGASRYQFRVEGKAGHAGTVPIAMRKDALIAASEMIVAMERIGRNYQNLVVTVGKLSVHPGASNVIPGEVEGTLDIRHIDNQIKDAALSHILQECETIWQRRGVRGSFCKIMESPAVSCSDKMISTIEAVLEENGMKPLQIVSGAGHDAMAVASITDIGMIFVRCRDGISHHPDEFVTVEDMGAGASVLFHVVLKLTR